MPGLATAEDVSFLVAQLCNVSLTCFLSMKNLPIHRITIEFPGLDDACNTLTKSSECIRLSVDSYRGTHSSTSGQLFRLPNGRNFRPVRNWGSQITSDDLQDSENIRGERNIDVDGWGGNRKRGRIAKTVISERQQRQSTSRKCRSMLSWLRHDEV